MIVSAALTTFAVIEAATCRHCGRRIELRRVIGWIHVQSFYLCAIVQDDDELFRAATPKP